MATSRVKMLFSDAPPDALEKLLSPKRKLIYGLFAFGPGTLLGLYLYSVKQQMEQENEAIRLAEMKSELSVVQARQDKNLALATAIKEMHDRLRRLEEEAIASRKVLAKATGVAQCLEDSKTIETINVGPSTSESKIDAALAVLTADEKVREEAASPNWLTSSLDGAQGRKHQRHQEMLEQDVAKYVAEQKKITK